MPVSDEVRLVGASGYWSTAGPNPVAGVAVAIITGWYVGADARALATDMTLVTLSRSAKSKSGMGINF